MKKAIITILFSLIMMTTQAQTFQINYNWDKTFPKSDKVDHEKITFRNRFGITLSADLYIPKDDGKHKLPAIAVSGPFGAVKEQESGLYAQRLAEERFLTIAFDPSFTGESSGEPRYSSSMDINTEDFCAAVDYLSCREDVDAERIGILGITSARRLMKNSPVANMLQTSTCSSFLKPPTATFTTAEMAISSRGTI